jgi:hypothetical protein
MGRNLESEVDVEAAADMMDYGKERKVGDGGRYEEGVDK